MTNDLLKRLRRQLIDGTSDEETMRQAAEEIERLTSELAWQSKEIDAQVQEIQRLREIAREVGTLDCFHNGGKCAPDCLCLSARAERLSRGQHEPSREHKADCYLRAWPGGGHCTCGAEARTV